MTGPHIPPGTTLGQALKLGNVASTGGEAKVLVQSGEVLVNGEVETRRGRRLEAGQGVLRRLSRELDTLHHSGAIPRLILRTPR